MARNNEEMPYRVGVGIMLINRAGLVWIGRRRPKWGDGTIWQMPQGGLAKKETPYAAALRELEEETGVRRVELLAEAPDWVTYDLPQDLVGVALKGRYRGQKQKWFAFRFTGDDSDVVIVPQRRSLKAEFEAWRWAYAPEVIDLAIDYKQPIYREVVARFAAHLAPLPERSARPATSAADAAQADAQVRPRPVSWRRRLFGRLAPALFRT